MLNGLRCLRRRNEIRHFFRFSKRVLNNFLFLCRYIAYCMKMVRMLRHFGVKPILVFDGGNLPIKRDQESTRRSYVHFSPFLIWLAVYTQHFTHKILTFASECLFQTPRNRIWTDSVFSPYKSFFPSRCYFRSRDITNVFLRYHFISKASKGQ
jgi:hypothetical protein